MNIKKDFFLYAFGVCLVLAVCLSPFASSWPDGLEKIAEMKGFLEKGEGAPFWSLAPFPDYAFSEKMAEGISTALAGIVGTVLSLALALALGRLLARKN